jgi:hypothetical protein
MWNAPQHAGARSQGHPQSYGAAMARHFDFALELMRPSISSMTGLRQLKGGIIANR